jgi:hypothetical protein
MVEAVTASSALARENTCFPDPQFLAEPLVAITMGLLGRYVSGQMEIV